MSDTTTEDAVDTQTNPDPEPAGEPDPQQSDVEPVSAPSGSEATTGEGGGAPQQPETTTGAADGAVPPAEPAAPALVVQQPQQPPPEPVITKAQAYSQHDAELAQIEALANKQDFDPFEDGKKIHQLQVQAERRLTQNLRKAEEVDEQRAVQLEANQYWTGFAAEHPQIGVAAGQKIWREIQQELAQQGYRGDALQGAATYAFKSRVSSTKPTTTPKQPTTPAKAPPVTPGGARPVSGSVPQNRPPARNKDELQRARAGEYGDLTKNL